MTAYTWSVLLLETAPYIISAGCIVLVILIYRLWRMKFYENPELLERSE